LPEKNILARIIMSGVKSKTSGLISKTSGMFLPKAIIA
jgi:hypothetical protein